MSETYALVVGVEQYDQQDWDISGPCANALAITRWLLSIATPPQNIFLFANYQLLDKKIREVREAEVAELRKQKVNVTESAKWEAIDTCFTKISEGRVAGSRLFVYWSGHGFVDNFGNRIFICQDYTADQLKNRVFDCSNYLRQLLSSTYQSFAKQIFLADTCAVYTHLKFVTPNNPPGDPLGVAQQIAFFASPEGKYAKGESGEGVFTKIALSVLGSSDGWPEQSTFSQSLLNELKKAGHTPFRIEGFDGERKIPNSVVGTFPPGNAIFDSVWKILSMVDLPDMVFRTHYLQTVSDLGEPGLTKAQGLSGMVRELASLQDAGTSEHVSFGLLQFLYRLSQIEELKTSIQEWLKENAKLQKNDLANIRRKVELENETKILIVEVENDQKGQISAFQPFLRMQDLSPANKMPGERQSVINWEDFCEKLQSVIANLQKDSTLKDFQIHFVADPPLFDRPFHLIPVIANGTNTLGEEFVVLLRCRERLRSQKALIRKSWEEYADALRPQKPSDLKLVQIPSHDVNLGRLLKDRGLCYTGFLLQYSKAATSAYSEEKGIVLRLLRMGVPFLYWLHQVPGARPECDCWHELESCLSAWLRNTDNLGEFPDAVSLQRVGKEEFAYHATLLWDDPQFNPFITSTGVANE